MQPSETIVIGMKRFALSTTLLSQIENPILKTMLHIMHKRGKASVCTMHAFTRASIRCIKVYLRRLIKAGFVKREKTGHNVNYTLKYELLTTLIRHIKELAS
jgi:predicted MarR family transcription regulator